MAESTQAEEEQRRRKAGGMTGGAVADDGDATFAILATVAVFIALIVGVFPAVFGGDDGLAGTAAIAADVEVDEPADADDETEEAAPVETTTTTEAAPEPEVDFNAAFDALGAAGFGGLGLELDGRTLIASGEIEAEEDRATVLDLLASQPNVENVVDQLTVAEPATVDLVADVAASQGGIVLTGVVPSQDVADDMVARAATVYGEDRVTDELTVDPGEVEVSSFTVNYTGEVTDPVLGQQLQGLFDGVAGAEIVSSPEVVESGDAEAALNALEPIQFASGSAEILPESAGVLDEAAAVLTANPDLALEVGGHTDSRGDDASNQALSEARAQAVVAALGERGVTNELTPVGYGETRLKENPDDTAEQQQANRRIEFRVL